MPEYIEDNRKWLLSEKDFICNSIQIKFKRKYVYYRFFFSENSIGKWVKKDKKEFLNFIKKAQGEIHSTIRHFFQ